MTIPLIHEPYDSPWGSILESCYFCKTPTRMWHENTNNPVCENCSKLHKVAELPDYGQRVRAEKRKKSIKIS